EDMPKTLSPMEDYLFRRAEERVRAEGIAEGEASGEVKEQARIVQKYIQNRRNRYLPEAQILEDLMSDFEIDEAKARQYMKAGLAKA
ncbi:MAG: hypothetical protein IKZ84_14415, partial [Victivallales bacterium]|nr:hypothetical protein [Victivallales bacterium]